MQFFTSKFDSEDCTQTCSITIFCARKLIFPIKFKWQMHDFAHYYYQYYYYWRIVILLTLLPLKFIKTVWLKLESKKMINLKEIISMNLLAHKNQTRSHWILNWQQRNKFTHNIMSQRQAKAVHIYFHKNLYEFSIKLFWHISYFCFVSWPWKV